MFSRAFFAFSTPAWRSASTLVVFPGANDARLFGDVAPTLEELDTNVEVDDSCGLESKLLSCCPSSANARAFPARKDNQVRFPAVGEMAGFGEGKGGGKGRMYGN